MKLPREAPKLPRELPKPPRELLAFGNVRGAERGVEDVFVLGPSVSRVIRIGGRDGAFVIPGVAALSVGSLA